MSLADYFRRNTVAGEVTLMFAGTVCAIALIASIAALYGKASVIDHIVPIISILIAAMSKLPEITRAGRVTDPVPPATVTTTTVVESDHEEEGEG
jgi:hypothetical protein